MRNAAVACTRTHSDIVVDFLREEVLRRWNGLMAWLALGDSPRRQFPAGRMTFTSVHLSLGPAHSLHSLCMYPSPSHTLIGRVSQAELSTSLNIQGAAGRAVKQVVGCLNSK